MRRLAGALLLATNALVLLAAVRTESAPSHWVFFDRDRDRIREASFLETAAIAGAQLKYTWRELEPEPGGYALDEIVADLEFLQGHGKGLFVQLQDVSFDEAIVNIPDWLASDPTFGGGAARQYEIEGDDDSTARPAGWVARRWDPAVRERFAALLRALARELDGRIEGINLPETSIEFGTSGRLHPDGFTYESYLAGILANMSSARDAFLQSRVLQYANFMPGEWLPWEDRGYLRAVYAHAARIGAGVGGPDLLPHRRGQRNHALALIAARQPGVLAGVAVQWGNLDDVNPETSARVTVRELASYSQDPLHLEYVFWGTQEPHYSDEVLPYLASLPARSPQP